MEGDRLSTASLYAQLLGDGYARLHPALQAFHGLQGHHVLEGEVRVEAAAGRMGRMLAALLGLPRQSAQGRIRFVLSAMPAQESWVRQFPNATLRSRLRRAGTQVAETLGPVRLLFVLAEQHGTLHMRLQGMRVLGIPVPAWLRPQVQAAEHGEPGRLCFDVSASMPLAGRVIRYSGWLAVAQVPDNGGQHDRCL